MRLKDSNNKIVNLSCIPDYLENNQNYQIFIGTDSKVIKKTKKVLYVTSLVLYKVGKGGRIFTSKETISGLISLRQRLSHETWRSIELTLELSKIIPKNIKVIIHIDVNKAGKFKSSEYHQELMAMVTSQGFQCKIKPESWCATKCSDRICKKER